jgi:hypothetical protein
MNRDSEEEGAEYEAMSLISANTELLEVEFYRENGKAFFNYIVKSRGEAPVTAARIPAKINGNPSEVRLETSRLASLLHDRFKDGGPWEGVEIDAILMDPSRPDVRDSVRYKRAMVLLHRPVQVS